jgi:hypothetical protein
MGRFVQHQPVTVTSIQKMWKEWEVSVLGTLYSNYGHILEFKELNFHTILQDISL